MINKEKNFISAVLYVGENMDIAPDFVRMIAGELYENFEHYEIICVNDGLDDSAAEPLKALSGDVKNGVLSVVNMSYRQGVELSMSAGVDLAIGDFVYEFDNIAAKFDKSLIMDIYRRCLTGFDIVSAGSGTGNVFDQCGNAGIFPIGSVNGVGNTSRLITAIVEPVAVVLIHIQHRLTANIHGLHLTGSIGLHVYAIEVKILAERLGILLFCPNRNNDIGIAFLVQNSHISTTTGLIDTDIILCQRPAIFFIVAYSKKCVFMDSQCGFRFSRCFGGRFGRRFRDFGFFRSFFAAAGCQRKHHDQCQ